MKMLPVLLFGIALLVGCGGALRPEGAPSAAEILSYRKGAEQGHAQAQDNLGICYAEGNGVAKDYTEAVKWFRKAAEQGYDRAQYNLGVLYDRGDGVAKDHNVAAKWYRKAAEQGLAEAQYDLGVCYAIGEGVAKDDVIAYMWYNLAAASGDEKAKRNRRIIEKRMTRDQIARAQSLTRKWKPRGVQFGKIRVLN